MGVDGVHRWQRELAARLRSRDRDALLELYDQMGSFVYGIALRITGCPDVAARITQEVFVGVWSRPEQLDGHGTGVRTRLAVLTHARAVEWVREGRTEAAAHADVEEADERGAGRFSDAEELADALATAGRVHGALTELTHEQRLALEVTYFGGNTYEAAGAILRIPGSVVAERVSAALHHVAGLLNPGTRGDRPDVAGASGDRVAEGADPDAAR
jgi:RNA polymerase sigma-70 factor, ECF subfamily